MMIRTTYKRPRAILYGSFVIFMLIALDQWVKVWVQSQQHFDVLCNYGIAFGIEIPTIFFVIAWIVVMIFVVYLWRKLTDDALALGSVIVVIAGSVSNMIDRLYYGCVIDYIPFFDISSYNFADYLITCGAIVLLWRSNVNVE